MTDKKIKVTIDAMGNPKVEAEGFAGEGCVDATQPIERALAGSGEVTREYKEEWSQSEGTNHEHVHQW